MKNIDIRIFILYVLFFFVAACSVTKKDKSAVIAVSKNPVITKVAVEPSVEPSHFNLTVEGQKWVDSVYNSMSLNERLGQLFMVAAYSNKNQNSNIEKLITENKIGGVIFFQGGPVRQAQLTNKYQSLSKIPLFIGLDAEWGLGMRLDSTTNYPYNMTLGAIQDLKLIEKLGAQMGKEGKRLGLHFNFAPVLDINTNARNPIIGFRSFGEDKINVSQHGIAISKGFQSQGVFATAKHFPGHGNTAFDSHKVLPTINSLKDSLENKELYPYKKIFGEGLTSVMVAHLNVPSLASRANYPSSLSYPIVTTLLQKELGFEGLIFTDALNMKAVKIFNKPGQVELEAFLAGNDILLFSEDVPKAIEVLDKAYHDALISEERLMFSVKKILKFKYLAGLKNHKAIELKQLYEDLNRSKNDALQYELYENAITVIKNTNSILPIKNIENQKIAYVRLGDASNSYFVETLKKYTEVTEVTDTNLNSLQEKLKSFSTVIIGYHKSDAPWKDYDFDSEELNKIAFLAQNNQVILDVFASPYALLAIKDFSAIKGLIVSYQNNVAAQVTSAELIFGAIAAKGKLPITVSPEFKVNFGLTTENLNVLGFATPENVGMNPTILSKIDAIAQKAINGRMTPGMQILVARKGKVIYQKAFGFHTYDRIIKVSNSDIYDLASLSKIIGTLPNVMQQYDEKKINLETTLDSMLPIFKNSNKSTIHFKELLLHYARLQAWYPFYKNTIDKKGNLLDKYYKKISDVSFSTKIADSLYLRNDYQDTIIKIIVDSKLLPQRVYKYSDFTFMILKDYLEHATATKLDVLSTEHFFKPLGLNNTMYNPIGKIDKNRIVPTEVDTYFRHQTVQGYVHDMGAAMQGGVGGHAGLFSNSMDVAKMMQMYLQKGNYADREYFSEKTFNDFNYCYYCAEGNRRGLGFDKPQLGNSGPTCGCASMNSFGHTGFTGTMAWADPDEEIVYVFLSNRTFPNESVNKLSKENIREDIQAIIYESIETKK